MNKSLLVSVLALIALGAVGAAHADSITFYGSATDLALPPSSNTLSASAQFVITGSDLVITLTNTAPGSTTDTLPTTLSGVFFNVSGNPTLTPVSAAISTGSGLIQGSTCTPTACSPGTTDVSGEFGYAQESGNDFDTGTDGFNRASEGISSSPYISVPGMDLFGSTILDGAPDALDGINFGIVSANADFMPTANISGEPLINDAVQFTLSGLPAGTTLADISDVSFQYCTNFNTPHFAASRVAVPEPAGLGLMAVGVLGIVGLLKRRGRGDKPVR